MLMISDNVQLFSDWSKLVSLRKGRRRRWWVAEIDVAGEDSGRRRLTLPEKMVGVGDEVSSEKDGFLPKVAGKDRVLTEKVSSEKNLAGEVDQVAGMTGYRLFDGSSIKMLLWSMSMLGLSILVTNLLQARSQLTNIGLNI
ncbi:hypothetical protein OSB04_018444 [Centaurea solstitialis]|uniref:Uncharacterized protein n=1 Tax=Centaurea solstitialis TaxID=347529 RepID=A0AA38T4V4_9ASTR|nr:hypothetical protein OSB04_018444 [Centaurea solstitialis]